MNQLEVESCPICWRTYQNELVIPVCFPCGHSCCRDCSLEVRSCSICRQRFSTSFQRRTNYSLLSMIEKVDQTIQEQRTNRPQTQEMQTQTETVPLRHVQSRAPRQRGENIKHQNISFQIKKTADGQLSAINLKFK